MMRSFSENTPNDKMIQRIKTCFYVQPFTPTKNDTRIEGYFIVDYTVLSLSHRHTLGGSYDPAFTVGEASKIWEVARKSPGSPVSVFTRLVVHSI